LLDPSALLDPDAVDDRAVVAAEIFDKTDVRVIDIQPGMHTGDGFMRNMKIDFFTPSDPITARFQFPGVILFTVCTVEFKHKCVKLQIELVSPIIPIIR
jgi:hypothetical protein